MEPSSSPFRTKVEAQWHDGPGNVVNVVDRKSLGQLKSLLSPKGDSHLRAREHICLGWSPADGGVDALLSDCAESFALAVADTKMAAISDSTQGAIAACLRASKSALEGCVAPVVDDWQSSQEFRDLLCKLKSLAEALIVAPYICIVSAAQSSSQPQAGPIIAFDMAQANPLLNLSHLPHATLFATLSKAAWVYTDSALKVHHSSNHKQPPMFSNQCVNATFACRALVYACKLLVDSIDALVQEPALLKAAEKFEGPAPTPIVAQQKKFQGPAPTPIVAQ